MANAPIEAKNTGTGAAFQAASSDTGNYTLPQLPVGTYEISVAVAGFKKYVRQNITVGVAQTLRVDIALEVGSASESVTVTENAPLLKTDSGELSHNVSTERMDSLPILGVGGTFATSQGLRTYLSEISAVPGAVESCLGIHLGVRVNGAPNGTAHDYRWRGFHQPDQRGAGRHRREHGRHAGKPRSRPATFGRVRQVGGGLFNITMRSGTNQYHGAGYDYLVNETSMPRRPSPTCAARTRRNDYGFNLGGPVWIPKVYNGKDKTFFFYNREQYREFYVVNDAPITVPTADYRLGNFAAAITGRSAGNDPLSRPMLEGMIFDPATTRALNGVQVRDAFPNNRIPLVRSRIRCAGDPL